MEMTRSSKKDYNGQQQSDEDDDDIDPNAKRQDLCVFISSERELRSAERIRIKAAQFTGLAIRAKTLTIAQANNLCNAIEVDAEAFQIYQSQQDQKAKEARAAKEIADKAKGLGPKPGVKSALKKGQQAEPKVENVKGPEPKPLQMQGLQANAPQITGTTLSGVVNLRFEDISLQSGAVNRLKEFLSKKPLIETIALINVEFQDSVTDFKKFMEGMQFSQKIRKVEMTGLSLDHEFQGKSVGRMLSDSRCLRELEVNNCDFLHPKSFYDMCSAMLTEKCRLNVFRFKGCVITELEAKVLQLIIMKNRQIHTLDLSYCKIEDPEYLSFFIQKMDQYSMVRYLTLDGISGDLSSCVETFADALAGNVKMEVLMMREVRIKWMNYQYFWNKLSKNKHLRKISVSKTDLTDRVLESVCNYLSQEGIQIVDLDLSRNLITDQGLSLLAEALDGNKTLLYLNLGQNSIKEKGIPALVNLLNSPDCRIMELSLNGNRINSDGIIQFAKILPINKSLQMLDIGKNEFSDLGFNEFAASLVDNQTLQLLDISRNKELMDEGSLVTLVQSLAYNKSIQTLDLSGLRVRKPFLKQHFESALKSNITLKYVVGKYTPDIIDEELNTNITIEQEIMPNYFASYRPKKAYFKIRLVDPKCSSAVILHNETPRLFEPALKFVKYHDIRILDLTGLQLQDTNVQLIADYLIKNPNLRSLILDSNEISDDGLTRLATALRENNKLAHLSFKDCKLITDEGLDQLVNCVAKDNTVLFQINFDAEHFNFEMGQTLTRESVMNRAIQEHLKPVVKIYPNTDGILRPVSAKTITALNLSSMHVPEERMYKEVIFAPGAPVSRYFDSALKCWRIHEPNIIQVEDQNLTDDLLSQLISFLSDKNFISTLNLRRNSITNKGAIELSDFLKNHDQQIYKIDLQRNRITESGGNALVQALKECVRILDLQLFYGNGVSRAVDFEIICELKANAQIIMHRDNSDKALVDDQEEDGPTKRSSSKVEVTGRGSAQETGRASERSKKSKKSETAMSKKEVGPSRTDRYELQDHGPEYIRCAIKSVELLNILHLALPDNNLGLTEARMIADMIKCNTLLKTLNLTNNKLEHQCGLLIGQALTFNDRLLKLDISQNELGDLGVIKMLKPLIKQRQLLNKQLLENKKEDNPQQLSRVDIERLLQSKIDSKAIVKKKTELNQLRAQIALINAEKKKNKSSSILQTQEEEMKIPSSMISLNLMENRTTLESYRPIWLLLETNPNLFIQFDSPFLIGERRLKEFGSISQSTVINNFAPALTRKLTLVSQQMGKSANSSRLSEDDDATGNQKSVDLDDNQEEDQSLDLEDNPRSHRANQLASDEEGNMSDSSGEESEETIKKKEEMLKWRKRKEKFNKCMSTLTCYKGYQPDVLNPDDLVPLRVICCWRMYKSRNLAYRYEAVLKDQKSKMSAVIESATIQKILTGLLLIQNLYFYTTLACPFIIDVKPKIHLYAITHFVEVALFELILGGLITRRTNFNPANMFSILKALVGFLWKVMIFGCIYISYFMFKNFSSGLLFFVGIAAALTVFINVIVQIRYIYNAMFKIDVSQHIRPLTRRNELIAHASQFCLLSIILSKLSIAPTQAAYNRARLIAIDLNPDLHHDKGSKCYLEMKNLYRKFGDSLALQHFLFIIAPSIFFLIIDYAYTIDYHRGTTYAFTLFLTLDMLVTISIFMDNEEGISQSIEADTVFKLGMERVVKQDVADYEHEDDIAQLLQHGPNALTRLDSQSSRDHSDTRNGLNGTITDPLAQLQKARKSINIVKNAIRSNLADAGQDDADDIVFIDSGRNLMSDDTNAHDLLANDPINISPGKKDSDVKAYSKVRWSQDMANTVKQAWSKDHPDEIGFGEIIPSTDRVHKIDDAMKTIEP